MWCQSRFSLGLLFFHRNFIHGLRSKFWNSLLCCIMRSVVSSNCFIRRAQPLLEFLFSVTCIMHSINSLPHYTPARFHMTVLRLNVAYLISHLNFQNLDALHDHLGTIYPGMRAPSFRCTDAEKGNNLILHYYSEREGLQDIVIGIIKTVAQQIHGTEIEMKVWFVFVHTESPALMLTLLLMMNQEEFTSSSFSLNSFHTTLNEAVYSLRWYESEFVHLCPRLWPKRL